MEKGFQALAFDELPRTECIAWMFGCLLVRSGLARRGTTGVRIWEWRSLPAWGPSGARRSSRATEFGQFASGSRSCRSDWLLHPRR